MKNWVAWLRGINVGAAGKGRKSVPMAELRELAGGLGWSDVRTYIQSGNVVFGAAGTAATHEKKLEQAIVDHFGFEVPVVVSAIADLVKAQQACPFAEVVDDRPNLVHIGFVKGGASKVKLKKSIVKELEPYCTAGERVAVQASYLWTDCPNGVGRSKLTPQVLDRVAGASVTMRNAKTLAAVIGMVE